MNLAIFWEFAWCLGDFWNYFFSTVFIFYFMKIELIFWIIELFDLQTLSIFPTFIVWPKWWYTFYIYLCCLKEIKGIIPFQEQISSSNDNQVIFIWNSYIGSFNGKTSEISANIKSGISLFHNMNFWNFVNDSKVYLL